MSDTPWNSSEMLRAIIQASPLAIVTLDAKDQITTWNPAAERVFGWSEAARHGSETLGDPAHGAASHPPLPASHLSLCPRKALPLAPGFRYNPHNL